MNQTRTTIASVTMLSEYFRQPLTDAAIEAYLIGLDCLTPEEVSMVTNRAIRESKFMPSAVELLAFAGKGGPKAVTARTAEAWEMVRRAMDRHDYTTSVDFGPLVNATISNLGGWQWLCGKSLPDLVWVRKDFERIYDAFAEKDPATLHGEALRGAFPGVAVRIGPAAGSGRPALPAADGSADTRRIVAQLAERRSS